MPDDRIVTVTQEHRDQADAIIALGRSIHALAEAAMCIQDMAAGIAMNVGASRPPENGDDPKTAHDPASR